MNRALNWCGTVLANKILNRAKKPIPTEPPVLCVDHYEHWAMMQYRFALATIGTPAECEFCQERSK